MTEKTVIITGGGRKRPAAMRVVAHLDYPYPLPHIEKYADANTITVAKHRRGFIAGCNIITRTFGMSSPAVLVQYQKAFPSMHSAVYDIIGRIQKAVSNGVSDDDSAFALRLCNMAYDEVNPKLF